MSFNNTNYNLLKLQYCEGSNAVWGYIGKEVSKCPQIIQNKIVYNYLYTVGLI